MTNNVPEYVREPIRAKSYNVLEKKYYWFKDGLYFRDENFSSMLPSWEAHRFDWLTAMPCANQKDTGGRYMYARDIVEVDVIETKDRCIVGIVAWDDDAGKWFIVDYTDIVNGDPFFADLDMDNNTFAIMGNMSSCKEIWEAYENDHKFDDDDADQ